MQAQQLLQPPAAAGHPTALQASTAPAAGYQPVSQAEGPLTSRASETTAPPYWCCCTNEHNQAKKI